MPPAQGDHGAQDNSQIVEPRPDPTQIEDPQPDDTTASVQAPASASASASAHDLDAIRIPALDINQSVIELSVFGTDLQVPSDYADIGWWSGGPAPGEQGAAVVVGHVDSPTGPAVFYQLSGLARGDRIVVERADLARMVYAVQRVTLYERSEFPSERVYRTRGPSTLSLLTCGGSFDAEAGQYTGNVVVFARLVDRVPAAQAQPNETEQQETQQQETQQQETQQQETQQQETLPLREQPRWYRAAVRDARERQESQPQETQQEAQQETQRPEAEPLTEQPQWYRAAVQEARERLATQDGGDDG